MSGAVVFADRKGDEDLSAITAIYAHHVLHGKGTFDEAPPSVEEMAEKFHKVVKSGWSWLVATDASGVLGYAYYTQFRDRSAYRYCLPPWFRVHCYGVRVVCR